MMGQWRLFDMNGLGKVFSKIRGTASRITRVNTTISAAGVDAAEMAAATESLSVLMQLMAHDDIKLDDESIIVIYRDRSDDGTDPYITAKVITTENVTKYVNDIYTSPFR